ncbi:hypothetical protein AAFF_G00039230 [Aldrovandia affinis]|uniref:Uncharacterized protein n=1 Tax=Aldrovandia affinis TaxID=143900 RepID=A0AAD7S3B6_9TELE|nr:hypothetical protein AAFF_G00039230 [Aldrovandia affinis]
MSNENVIKPKSVQVKTRSSETKTRPLETKPKTHTYLRKNRALSCPRCHHSNESEAKKAPVDGHGNKNERKPKPTTASLKPKLSTFDQKEQHVHRMQHKTIHEFPSGKAFTVIAPNPKKRHEIKQKAEAELAALEDFKLSRAMGYMSIAPSTVGGCLTLEEVRNKQQEMHMNRKQKQMKRCAPETSALHKS